MRGTLLEGLARGNRSMGHNADGRIDSDQVEVAIGFSLESQEDAVHIMTTL
jgi:hypothetical protein